METDVKNKNDMVRMPFSWREFYRSYNHPINYESKGRLLYALVSIALAFIVFEPIFNGNLSSAKNINKLMKVAIFFGSYLFVMFLVYVLDIIERFICEVCVIFKSIFNYITLKTYFKNNSKKIVIKKINNIALSYNLDYQLYKTYLNKIKIAERFFSESELKELSKSQRSAILCYLAGHHNTNNNTLVFLAKNHGFFAIEAFDSLDKRGLLDEVLLNKLSKSENPAIIYKVIWHQNTNNNTLICLAKNNATGAFKMCAKRGLYYELAGIVCDNTYEDSYWIEKHPSYLRYDEDGFVEHIHAEGYHVYFKNTSQADKILSQLSYDDQEKILLLAKSMNRCGQRPFEFEDPGI